VARYGQRVQQHGLRFIVRDRRLGQLRLDEVHGLVVRLVGQAVAGGAGQAERPQGPGRMVRIAGTAGGRGPTPAAVVILLRDQQADGGADAGVERFRLSAGGVAGQAEQLLQRQGGHQVGGGRVAVGSERATFRLAPGGRSQDRIQQAALDGRPDQDLQPRRGEHHAGRRLDHGRRVAGGRAAGNSVHRQAEGPHRHAAADDVAPVACGDGQLEFRRRAGLALASRFRRQLQRLLETQLLNALGGDRQLLGFGVRLVAQSRRQGHLDFALLDGVVVYGDDHFGLVAVGIRGGAFQLAEQVLADREFLTGFAAQRVLRDALGQQRPAGRTVGQNKGQRRFAVRPGNHGRVPVAGFVRRQAPE